MNPLTCLFSLALPERAAPHTAVRRCRPVWLLGAAAGIAAGLGAALASSGRAENPPALVPLPREVRWAGADVPLAPGSVAIVIGRNAVDPEREGARLLREFVAKRFKEAWPIVIEGEEQAAHRTLVVLGQRSTCQLLDRLCTERRIELSAASPGPDGYVIEWIPSADRMHVLVGGSNPRGAMYGQDTLAQMLRRSGDRLALVPGTVRDAPVVPWRGRPQTMVKHYLRPGELDIYAMARVNFIDLRSGIYAFEPGEKLDHAQIAEAVGQAHRRGFIVYATVNCGVPRQEYPSVMATFRELLDLGADGLWLSFDDKGPGEDPVDLTRQVLALGRPRGIAGHLIAITPPKGSYPKINTEFNRKLLAVPGMETALWFWTAVPSPEAEAEARTTGLKVRPSWWHNWPRLFTPQGYTGLPPLSLGWSAPDYAQLAVGGECLEAAMPWGGNALGRHYVVPVINWWAWNPRQHDWNVLRRRIYSMVFGEAQAAAAAEFDDKLQQLFALYRHPYKSSEEVPASPPQLGRPEDREVARALAEEMTTLLERLAAGAERETVIDATDLKTAYLEPMRRELATHRATAELDFPEEWWPETQRQILAALYAGDSAAGERGLADARTRVTREVDRIATVLPELPQTKKYVEWWQRRAALDLAGWKVLQATREKALGERIVDYNRIVKTHTMVAALGAPPLEWGIGRWQVSNRLLATTLPRPESNYRGDWLAGLYREDGIEAAVFAASRKVPGEIGEYAELPASVPVSGRRDRLGLLVFVSSTNKDLFSNTMIPYRWAGYRFIQVMWRDQVLWEHDLGQIPETGDWFMIRLPQIPAGVSALDLRLRVEDRRVSLNNYTVAFVSPLRLMELPE